jgi:hypothetical protein
VGSGRRVRNALRLLFRRQQVEAELDEEVRAYFDGCVFTQDHRLESRKSLVTELALVALRNAIESRRPAPGLIHHSDRGAMCIRHLCRHAHCPRHSSRA